MTLFLRKNVAGALAIKFGLNVVWCIIAIVFGNRIGAVFMVYHSVQGLKLGIPQMIQSRAQFGVVGFIFPLVIVVLMYIGFFKSSGVLRVQALSNIPMFLLVLALSLPVRVCTRRTVLTTLATFPPAHLSLKSFAYSYTRTVISSMWMMLLDVILTAAVPKFLNNST